MVIRNSTLKVLPKPTSRRSATCPAKPAEGTQNLRILIGTDDLHDLKLLRCYCQTEAYAVVVAHDPSEVLQQYRSVSPDLIILEVNFAHLHDWETLKALQVESNVPIIGLIELGNLDKMEEGLRLGIDDYLFKPLNPCELNDRIRVILFQRGKPSWEDVRELDSGGDRRSLPERYVDRTEQPPQDDAIETYFTVGPFQIDDRCKSVFAEGKECQLSPKEYALLRLLAVDPGRVVSADEIIRELWPHTSHVVHSDVKRYVHRLRHKVEKNPKKPRWIENIRGFGYRLAVSPAEKDDQNPF